SCRANFPADGYPPHVSSTRIIVPHRGLEAAKTRLASTLTPQQRVQLARSLLERVLDVACRVSDDVIVISPSLPLAEVVDPTGAQLVVQRGMGLNAGLDQARFDAVMEGVGTLVVIHGDLPNLRPSDLEALIGALSPDDSPGVAIAPDRAGTGTNGLVLRSPDIIGFRFGRGSF